MKSRNPNRHPRNSSFAHSLPIDRTFALSLALYIAELPRSPAPLSRIHSLSPPRIQAELGFQFTRRTPLNSIYHPANFVPRALSFSSILSPELPCPPRRLPPFHWPANPLLRPRPPNFVLKFHQSSTFPRYSLL